MNISRKHTQMTVLVILSMLLGSFALTYTSEAAIQHVFKSSTIVMTGHGIPAGTPVNTTLTIHHNNTFCTTTSAAQSNGLLVSEFSPECYDKIDGGQYTIKHSPQGLGFVIIERFTLKWWNEGGYTIE